MAKIIIYNNEKDMMETYTRGEEEPMPYNNGSLTVGEFRGSSKSSVLWSDKTTMDTFVEFRKYYGKPIYVGYAFKRSWEGGHGKQSQHYAGVAFDIGQNLSSKERTQLYNSAKSFRKWSYVEPISMTPTWVHIDKRYGKSACSSGGYPTIRFGDKGVYVLILQDALNALGYSTKSLDGIYGNNTSKAVKDFQKAYRLTSDGIVGCTTWKTLTNKVVGMGKTSTVID